MASVPEAGLGESSGCEGEPETASLSEGGNSAPEASALPVFQEKPEIRIFM